MTRMWMRALLVVALSASMAWAGLTEDFAAIEAIAKSQPKSREEAMKLREDLMAKVKAFTEAYADKAEEHPKELGTVYFYRGLMEDNAEFVAKAKALSKAHAEAHPEDEEAQQMAQQMAQAADEMAEQAAAEAERDALKGKLAPAIEADEVLDGEVFTLADHKGKVVVLDFWATWCPPCRQVIPHLVETYEKHKDEGLVILGVTRFYGYGFVPGEGRKQDLDEDAERQVNRDCGKAMKITYPIVFAPKAMPAYKVQGIPQLVVIDRAGKVRFVRVGAGDHSEFDKVIAECLAEKVEGEATEAGAGE